MNQRFRMYQRGASGRYYIEDNTTGKQESLGTTDRVEAQRLFNAKNEATYQTAFNAQMARAYLVAGDPEICKRTWQQLITIVIRSKERSAKSTKERYESAFAEKPFDDIKPLVIVETRAETILEVIDMGTVSTNMVMQRLHAYALGLGWLPWPIITYKRWPQIKFQQRRAITAQEAATLIAAEKNEEWRLFLELLWHVGSAQVDLAALTAANVDWENRIISYFRKKTCTLAMQRFGEGMADILKRLPSSGLLFPHLSKLKSADRATRFSDRCKKHQITGVSLHSYRYAWAERAYESGYPERYAQAALGHSSAAVHQSYAKGARVKIPSLEEYEKTQSGNNIVQLSQATVLADEAKPLAVIV